MRVFRRTALPACCVMLVACNPGSLLSKSDAGASGAGSAEAKAAPPVDPDPLVDLLHTVEATVAVSSKVDNPHDYPEHLVDGKPETAWNGKTGDLNGWIAFRVPKTAKVARIEITAGFDKSGPKGDLFTMNYRIKKVRVSRQGQVLKEASLDTAKRGLQAIDVDAPGGDFKIDVVETLPGTEKGWRELTVSELRVWGRTGGAPENPTHIPKMAIASLDGRPPAKPLSKSDPPRGPFQSTAELCTAYDKTLTPLIDAKFTDDQYPGKLPGPHCASKGNPKGFSSVFFKHAPFTDALFVETNDTEQWRQVLLLKTGKGWFRTDVTAASRFHGDPGCLHGTSDNFEDVQFAKTSTGQEVALIRIVHREVAWMQMDEKRNGADSKEVFYACRADVNGAATCEGPKALATAHEPLPASWDPGDSSFYEIKADRIPWVGRKKPAIGPAGDMRTE